MKESVSHEIPDEHNDIKDFFTACGKEFKAEYNWIKEKQ